MTEQKTDTPAKTGLALLREPFPPNMIGKLPKPTKRQTEEVRNDFKKGIRCQVCGQWHHPDVVHLDYVGHAALTDRLLDCDPNWNWEPVATNEDGTPRMDHGGMWIKLTVCNVTRLGYGDADGKTGGNAIKEVIGDALRNAAMRFGAALDLWHKGELHVDDNPLDDDDRNNAADNPPKAPPKRETPPPSAGPFDVTAEDTDRETAKIKTIDGLDELASYWAVLKKAQIDVAKHPDVIAAKDKRKRELKIQNSDPQNDRNAA